MSDDLNKLDLLIKIMRMTEGDNDNMSLVAIKKANRMLAEEKWDWDRLLRGKVKVIADPFAKTSAPAPQAKPASMQQPKPQYQAPQPAKNVWPNGQPPKPAPKPASPPPPPPKPKQPPQAPAGPLHFRRGPSGEWTIASYMKADQLIGQKVMLCKKDGSTSEEICGPYIAQDIQSGHYLYKIGKITKWKSKYADVTGINDLI